MKLWKVEIGKQRTERRRHFLPRMGAGWDQDGSEAAAEKMKLGKGENWETTLRFRA